MLTAQDMVNEAWRKTPEGTNATYGNSSNDGGGDDPPATPQVATTLDDILSGIWKHFGIGMDPEDPKNRDKIDQGKKNVTEATEKINELNKTIIVNGVLIIVTEGVGYAVVEYGGAVILRVLSKAELRTAEVAAKSSAQIGTKLEYVFGKATGSAHNIERSTGMLRQLESVGIFDNAAGRSLLNSHLEGVYNGTKGVLQSNGRYLRESLLMGPNGGLKVESIWEGNRLITVKLLGGR
ncbi:MAG: hypothetical protein A2W96_10665 [Bacteroidetes bacterium GWD2_40_43]|nr:MAG: hypothetical protein A2W96_10665 [Bacteroidetes bacterium GWD2_40_43]